MLAATAYGRIYGDLSYLLSQSNLNFVLIVYLAAHITDLGV